MSAEVFVSSISATSTGLERLIRRVPNLAPLAAIGFTHRRWLLPAAPSKCPHPNPPPPAGEGARYVARLALCITEKSKERSRRCASLATNAAYPLSRLRGRAGVGALSETCGSGERWTRAADANDKMKLGK